MNKKAAPSPERLKREAEALRENLAKRKQQARLRQTVRGKMKAEESDSH
ncbi:MAG: hypothetical protein HY053_04605 [Proteobacteria bacterium]|nr:hypothetical protein [Pseudomonadota bacterium]